MKTNNKILLFLIIFIGILLLFTIDCFAYSAGDTVTINPLEGESWQVTLQEDLPEAYSDFNYFCISSNYSITIFPNNVAYMKISEPNDEYVIASYYDASGNVISTKGLIMNNAGEFNPYGSNPKNKFVVQKSIFYNTDSSILAKAIPYTIYNEDDTIFFKVTPTLEETLVEGYKVAKTTIHQTTKQQVVEILPVGIIILATMIVVSLIAYFRFWRQ